MSGPTCSNLMILESFSIKLNAISKCMTFKKIFGSQGDRSRPFYGSDKVEKAKNVAHGRFAPTQSSMTGTPVLD